ncbi:MAG: hypothetical protein U5Q03_06805 [Bacteroidota bacterium]|nr:hypothetical protein [Bacteroidota bacterium]
MNKNKRTYIWSVLLIALLASAPAISNAQAYMEGRSRFSDNWRVNVNLGSTLFYGDIQNYKFAPYREDWRLAYGIMFRKQFSRFSVSGSSS